ncbi:CAP Gly-rich domain-containing protein, partial [Pilaira anomala]
MNPVDYAKNDYPTEDNLNLGQRVNIPSLSVSGTVRFFGETKFMNGGNWVGIELDIKGTGKNDGSIQGVRYFSCPPETGIFILSSKVVAEKQITPRISKTTGNKSTGPVTRKSMITNTKRSQPTTITPSKSARILSNSSHQPLPTRSSPSSNKKSNQIVPLSKSTTTTAKLKKSCSLSTTSSSESNCQHRLQNEPVIEKKKLV